MVSALTSRDDETQARVGRWPWVLAAVVVAALVAAGALWFRYRDTATPLAVADVVEQFDAVAGTEPTDESEPVDETGTAPDQTEPDQTEPDETTADEAEPAVAATQEATTTPIVSPVEAGVYVYQTTGGEEIDPLGGTRHDYPAETTLTVRAGGCGVIVRWQPLEERFEEFELCIGDDGLAIDRYTTFHRFFGTDDQRDFVCDPAIALTPTGDAGHVATCVAGDLTEVVSTSVLATRSFTIGSDEVEATGFAIEAELEGPTTGTTQAEMWATSGGLIVSWSEVVESDSGSPIGDVHYSEEFSIELTLVEPIR